MPKQELILKVSKERKRDIYDKRLHTFYTFETDGIPGHNIYRDIAAYRIQGIPKIGLIADYIAGENALNSSWLPLWKIIKSNENIK